MAKSLLILLNIVLTVEVILAAEFEFEFLARFGYTKEFYTPQTVYDYYISKNPATWSTAQSDCISYYGSRASLLSIETEKEWEFIQGKLGADVSKSGLFWTSGMYKEETNNWKWSSIGLPIQSFIPWSKTEPIADPNPQHRVLLFFRHHSTFIEAAYHTEHQRYICKVPRSGLAVPCYDTSDLIVVLDSSASITNEYYTLAKHFIARFVAAFTIYEPSRISFIIYSQNASTIINLPDVLTSEDMHSKIIDAPHLASNTATDLGINEAIRQFIIYPRKIPRSMVIFTDGHSNDPRKTSAAASNIITMGIRTFSVAISKLHKYQELLAIAGGDRTRVFTMQEFDKILDMLVSLSENVCLI